MELVWASAFVVAGIVLLAWCGDQLVSGSVTVARHFKLSRVFVGVAIMGFGTSLPEIITCVSAAINGNPMLLLGNIVGSNIANVGLPLGLALLLFKQHVHMNDSRTDLWLMITAYVLLGVLIAINNIYWPYGVGLILSLFAFITFSLKAAKTTEPAAEEHRQEVDEKETGAPQPMSKAVMFITIGLVGLVIGANLLIDGAITFAHYFGISERIIGLTLVAIGTSLPEIAASLAAVRKNETHIMIGNVLGSNMFNVLGGIGAGALFTTLPIAAVLNDYIIMVAIALLMVPLFFINKIHSRILGGLMIASYVGYIIHLAIAG